MADEQEPTYEANTVIELKDELAARDLPTSGNKEELIARLEEDDAGRGVQATSAEVALREGTEAEAEVPDYYPVQKFSPWELPANTAAAQQFIERGLVVDESLVPPDDVLAAANNEIELHGHPDDPRLSGGSIIENPLSAQALANPTRAVEIEQPEYVERDYRTVGQVQEAESNEEEANA